MPPSDQSAGPSGHPPVIQPRRLRPLQMLWVAAVLAALFVWTLRRHPPAATAREALRMDGFTMGTTWSVRIADPQVRPADLPALRAAVESALAEVNRQMSTYDPSSEISRFNDSPAGVAVEISPDFDRVLRFALTLAEQSGGAFDPTVGPLVELWGFGRKPRSSQAPPTEEEIAAVREAVGYAKVTLDGEGRLTKTHDGVRLDLNAVAKGYGVDAAARALGERGLKNFFVEVGGEVVVRGERAGGGPWRIGVDRPRPDSAPGEAIERVLHIRDAAVATSGDYRNYHRDETSGEVYAHIFDPRTGRPVRRMAGSVTVIADECLKADGLATALYVLGPEEGLDWLARTYPEADALFIVRHPDGALEQRASARFDERTSGR